MSLLRRDSIIPPNCHSQSMLKTRCQMPPGCNKMGVTSLQICPCLMLTSGSPVLLYSAMLQKRRVSFTEKLGLSDAEAGDRFKRRRWEPLPLKKKTRTVKTTTDNVNGRCWLPGCRFHWPRRSRTFFWFCFSVSRRLRTICSAAVSACR